MESPLSAGRQIATHEELIAARGRDCAHQLQQIFLGSCKTEADLADKVFESFTNTLFVPNMNSSVHDGDLDHQVLHSQGIEFASTLFLSTEAIKSEESSSRCSTPKGIRRRECYKKRGNSHTRFVDSPRWIHDGHAWRKYGQKVIHNSKFPRHYFRCTHKNEQGCQASKQVQKMHQDPPLYRTTYFGHHTCKASQKDHEITFEDLVAEEEEDSSISKIVINFSAKNQGDLPLSCFSSLKTEQILQNYEEPSRHVIQNQPSSLFDHMPASQDFFSEISSSTQIPHSLSRLDSSEFDYIFEEAYYQNLCSHL